MRRASKLFNKTLLLDLDETRQIISTWIADYNTEEAAFIRRLYNAVSLCRSDRRAVAHNASALSHCVVKDIALRSIAPFYVKGSTVVPGEARLAVATGTLLILANKLEKAEFAIVQASHCEMPGKGVRERLYKLSPGLREIRPLPDRTRYRHVG
jgi:hypothetical protein